MCLTVTCHLHFWQNDWNLLGAIAMTRGWNGYRNKCVDWLSVALCPHKPWAY